MAQTRDKKLLYGKVTLGIGWETSPEGSTTIDESHVRMELNKEIWMHSPMIAIPKIRVQQSQPT